MERQKIMRASIYRDGDIWRHEIVTENESITLRGGEYDTIYESMAGLSAALGVELDVLEMLEMWHR